MFFYIYYRMIYPHFSGLLGEETFYSASNLENLEREYF
jgi:hypothetical protein